MVSGEKRKSGLNWPSNRNSSTNRGRAILVLNGRWDHHLGMTQVCWTISSTRWTQKTGSGPIMEIKAALPNTNLFFFFLCSLMTEGVLSELHDDQRFPQLRGGVRNAGKRSGSLREWHREWQRVLFPSPAISQPRYTPASLFFPRFQSPAMEWPAGSWNCPLFFPLPVTKRKERRATDLSTSW